ISGENDTIVMAWMEMDNLNSDIFYSVSVPGADPLDALTNYKYKGNVTTAATQTNPEIIYKNGIVHLFFQENGAGDLYYRRGTIDLNLGLLQNAISIGISPNPSASGTFNIEGNVTIDAVQSISGEKVEFSVTYNGGTTQLSLENAPSGMYFISATGHNGYKSTSRIIVN
ncbi:MAG: T9SS type A sorting domain-containing protein, partial [Crocinitomicaceae bacterium]|nr:T9SS type A sorting domain-containing protein [Crocinitomicaceae bacterium]